MTLRARLRKLADRVNALSLRERGMLMLAVFAVVFLLADLLAMRPVSERQQQVQRQLEEVRSRVGDLTSAIQQVAAEQSRDPNRELESRQADLEAEIAALERRLSERHGGIPTPRESVAVLTGLLGKRAGVDIIELENLPVEALENSRGEVIPGIFVHRVRLVIETDFEGVRKYLSMVEKLPASVFWDSLGLTAPNWPINRLELILYSLAIDDRWLGV